MIVYIIADALTGDARYVGITNDPKRRAAQHSCSQDSAVFPYAKSAERAGLHPKMYAIAEFDDVASARRLESSLIAFIPGLLNRDTRSARRAHWRPQIPIAANDTFEIEDQRTCAASLRKRGRPKIEGLRPWEAESISRMTWYRRNKKQKQDGNK